jgi:NAD(P)H-hydrate epimerase
MAALLASTHVEMESLPLLAAYACEIHGQAGAIAAERYGSHGVMATDVIDAIGLATDAIEQQVSYPEAADEQ